MPTKLALSPGEVSLLRVMRTTPGPIQFRDLMRMPGFHGWDLDTLRIMAERLSEDGLLQLKGDTVQLRHASSDRIVKRFLAEG